MIAAVKDYAIFLLDENGFIRTWNIGAERIKGYKADEIIGKHFSIFYTQEDLDDRKPERELEIAKRTGKYEEEGIRLRKDGSRFWASVTLTAIFDSEGTLRGFGKVTRDISERKRTEFALRSLNEHLERRVQERTLEVEKSRRLLQLIVDSLPAFVAYIDPHEKYEFVNHAYEVAFGAAKSAFIGNSMRDALGNETYSSLEPFIKTVLEGRRVEFEVEVTIKGQQKMLRATYVPEFDETGKVRGFVILSHDITRLKSVEQDLLRALEAEQSLRKEMEKANARMRLLAEASTKFLSSLDYQGTLKATVDLAVPLFADWCAVDILSSDSKIERIAVKHADPEKVKLAWKLNELYPPAMDQSGGIGKVLREGKALLISELSEESLREASINLEHFQILKSLGLKSAIVTPLVARGKTLGAITLIASESNRRFTQDDLLMAEELGRRAGLAIENARLFQESTEAVRARDEFISIASHELKTPLTSMGIQLQLLERSMGNSDGYPPIFRKSVDVSLRQIDRLNRMVNDMLDISRLTTGRLTLEKEEVEIGALIRDVVFRFQPSLTSAHCEPVIDIEGEIVGTWDKVRLDQVISNLLSNAIKYAPDRPIEIHARERDGYVRISVRDYGPGVPVSEQERIFQRFERAVPHSSISGLGLGLYITRQIVELHGGTIHVESEPGQGANFIVDLPLRTEKSQRAA